MSEGTAHACVETDARVRDRGRTKGIRDEGPKAHILRQCSTVKVGKTKKTIIPRQEYDDSFWEEGRVEMPNNVDGGWAFFLCFYIFFNFFFFFFPFPHHQ